MEYVAKISELTILVRTQSETTQKHIEHLGGEPTADPQIWRIYARTEIEQAKQLESLRDHGLAFGGGWGWEPAGVVEWLRSRGLFHGPFEEVVWLGDGKTSRTVHPE